MNKPNANTISEEEVKEKVCSIYKEVKERKITYSELSEKYEINKYALGDLSQMDRKEFENFMDEISYIKESIQEGKTCRKISSKIGCGSAIVGYISNQMNCQSKGENLIKIADVGYISSQMNCQSKGENLIKIAEVLWKENQKGKSIKNLANEYNMNIEYVEDLITSFNNLVNHKKEYYGRLNPNVALDKAKSLKKTKGLDDDTIAYIVEGKEIKKIKEEEGASLDEP